jgi:hypothetical protein
MRDSMLVVLLLLGCGGVHTAAPTADPPAEYTGSHFKLLMIPGHGLRAIGTFILPDDLRSSTCPMKQVGDCLYCTADIQFDPTHSTGFNSDDAGELDVRSTGDDTFHLPLDVFHEYVDFKPYPMLWRSPGDDITVHGPGALVPAFDLHAPAPSATPVTVTHPLDRSDPMYTIPTWTPNPINSTKELIVTWSGGGSDPVHVTLEGDSRRVICRFDGATGTGTIPREALATLLGQTVEIEVVSGTIAIDEVGAYRVRVSTVKQALDDMNEPFDAIAAVR